MDSQPRGQTAEPLAVIGLSCRFPGTASSPEKLWEMLSEARTAWTPSAGSRFNMKNFHHPEKGRPGTTFAAGAHFLKEDVTAFDRNFFTITASEANSMDPQIRHVLEVAFETFENAGYSMDKMAGSDTGVFVGAWSHDYQVHLARDPDNAPAYEATGVDSAIIANRISYFYDLKGPSFTLDTACSASLYALHQAVLSLRSGESRQAFVAGVNLLLDPTPFFFLGKMRLLGNAGRCYAFDERASGYGRGEGVGGILIKPLKDAIRDGDSIRAVIRNTAVNQDGRTAGITLPSGAAQEAAIRYAYSQAGLELDADYVECHGTGTAAGDPTETAAIANTIAANRTKENPTVVGSIKANIGHLEAAAGMASLIKGVLMLEKQTIPPQALLQNVNPKLDLDALHLALPRQLQEAKNLNRISVNGFGFGGANAHVILEKAPVTTQRQLQGSNQMNGSAQGHGATLYTPGNGRLQVISGNSKEACRRIAADLMRYSLTAFDDQTYAEKVDDIAFSLARRSHLKYRVAFAAGSEEEYIEKLESVQSKELEPFICQGEPGLCLAFTGQGAQWFAMGRELLQQSPAFRQSIDKADAVIAKLGCEWNLFEELSKTAETTRLDDPGVGQPCCTAIQVALIDAVKSAGIKPAAVVGHSSGEIAACYASGAASFEDAMTISYQRGRLVSQYNKTKTTEGAMMAVGDGPQKIESIIAEVPGTFGQMRVACINSPKSVTVSGDKTAVEELKSRLEEEGIFNRLLKTNGAAYHSHQMEPIADAYLKALSTVTGREVDPNIQWISSVTGQDLCGTVVGPKYWVHNLVSPVLFSEALTKTCSPTGKGIGTIVEIGPHSTLAGPIKQILKAAGSHNDNIAYYSALVRKQSAVNSTLGMIGSLWTRGHAVNLEAANALAGAKQGQILSDLPNYAWDHDTKCWHQSRLAAEYTNREFSHHELLGVRAPNFNPSEPTWRNYIRLSELQWLKGHEVHGQVIWPAAAYVAMAIEASRQTAITREPLKQPSKYTLRDVSFSKALIVRPDTESELIFSMRPVAQSARESSKSWDEFRIFSVTGLDSWNEHCRGLIGVQYEDDSVEAKAHEMRVSKMVSTVAAKAQRNIETNRFYGHWKSMGINWHDAFGNLSSIRAGPLASTASVQHVQSESVSSEGQASPYVIHPGTLDSCFQTSFVPMMVDGKRWHNPLVVTHIDKIELTPGNDPSGDTSLPLYCQSSVATHDIGTIPGAGSDRYPFQITIDKLHLTEVPGEGATASEMQFCASSVNWEVLPTEKPETNGHHENGVASVNGMNGVNGTNGIPNAVVTSNGNGHSSNDLIIEVLLGDKSVATEDLANRIFDGCKHADVQVKNFNAGSFKNNICVVVSLDEHSFLSDLQEADWVSLKEMVLQSAGILWITAGSVMDCSNPTSASVTGFARTIRVENPDFAFATLDLDMLDLAPESACTQILKVLEGPIFDDESKTGTIELEYAYRQGQMFVPRVSDHEDASRALKQIGTTTDAQVAPYFQQNRPLVLEVKQPGLVDSLQWNDDVDGTRDLQPDEVRLQALTHGVNFRDLLMALGQLGKDATMAGEVAGVITAVGSSMNDEFAVGDRVCAFAARPYASFPIVKGHTCCKIPESISFETAACLPIVYSTVVYALVHLGNLQRGEKVLIHSATGGVGQAAVMLAHHIGAEVFATVGKEEKKRFLVEKYGVAEDHIFSSRTTAFREGIMAITDNKGVDLVLNSLTGEFFRESVKCLGLFGRFIEIGKKDLINNTKMDMDQFLNNLTFNSVDLMLVGQHKPALCKKLMKTAIDLVSSGKIKAMDKFTAPLSDISSIFRQMQGGKHMGKFVLTADNNTQVKVADPKPASATFDEKYSYVVVGGLGGIGKKLLSWMSDRGAKHIVTLSRSGSKATGAQEFIDEMATRGTTVYGLACDITSENAVRTAFKEGSFPPVRGLIQAAMVLQDALFENMSFDQWTAATRPKIQGTINLHKVLESQPLNFFIMISSIVSIVGNAGQAAYAAANSFLDGLARHRTVRGLPATSINLGVVSDAGFVAENAEVATALASKGFSTVETADLFALLDYTITNPKATTADKSQICIGLGASPAALKDTKFKTWLEKHGEESDDTDSAGAGDGIDVHIKGMKQAASVPEATTSACAALLQQLSKLLGAPLESLNAQATLMAYGIDSLMNVELRNWIRTELKANVQLLEMSEGGRSIKDLAGLIASRSKLVQTGK